LSTHVLEGRPRELAFARCRLAVVEGPDRGRAELTTEGELAVGTAEANQLVLTDPTVSRYHFVITWTPRGYHLRDTGSTNGTFLAGHRVDSAYLVDGSIVRAGITTFRFEAADGEIRAPLSDDDRFGRALGRSPAMRRLWALLPRIAASESTVLIDGETGTGKSLLARAIHAAGRRARGPFVVVDCGAIPAALIESELFGHERGAFTGAVAARPGAFEAAAGGTVFLDEIGELPLDMQPKLLHALEERAVRRVGSNTPTALDVRILAATNRDLRQAVNRGGFRSDLYYRLNIVKVRLPPLRERAGDVALLAEAFYRELTGNPTALAPPALLTALAQHDWPGNVRELRAAVERSLLVDDPSQWQALYDEPERDDPDDDTEEPTDPGVGAAPAASLDTFDDALTFRAAKERATLRWERWYLGELLRRHGNNLSRASRAARMDRTHLRELARRYKLLGSDGGDD
jgi:two-component system, NtrC family, response regulator GlrR